MALQPNPKILEWALERSGVSRDAIIKEWPKYDQWVSGEKSPTVKQIRDFADKVHINVSALFSDSLPQLGLQIADFRTADDQGLGIPSPELYDTIGLMVARQEWMHSYFLHEDRPPVKYVGSFSEESLNSKTVSRLVAELHTLLQLDDDWAVHERDVAAALKTLKSSIEYAGISVAINGVVGNNSHRCLNEHEFRGFALSDEYAPLIFINGKDKKTAQIFTLIHELCHLAFFETGVSNPLDEQSVQSAKEKFCNKVAADFLVPTNSIYQEWENSDKDKYDKIKIIAARHKVNFIVVARKMHDEGIISDSEFFKFYRTYKDSVPESSLKTAGGDYYKNMQYKLGNVFADAIWSAVNLDFISYRDAYALSGMKGDKFIKYFTEKAC